MCLYVNIWNSWIEEQVWSWVEALEWIGIGGFLLLFLGILKD